MDFYWGIQHNIFQSIPSSSYGKMINMKWELVCLRTKLSVDMLVTRYHRTCDSVSCIHHYGDVIMGAIGSQITSLTIVYSTVYSKKTSKLRVTGLWAGNSPGTSEFPVQMAINAEKKFSFVDVIMWIPHFPVSRLLLDQYVSCQFFNISLVIILIFMHQEMSWTQSLHLQRWGFQTIGLQWQNQ